MAWWQRLHYGPRELPPWTRAVKSFVQQSVATQLGLSVLAVATVLCVVGAWLLQREGGRAVDGASLAHMEVLAAAVEGSYHVFDGDKKIHPVADMVAEVGRNPGVDALQVFDGRGTVRFSIRPSERGTVLPPAHLLQEEPTPGRDLALVRHFSPRSACVTCHQDTAALGGVRIVVNRARLQGALLHLRFQTGVSVALLMAAITLAVLLLARRIVVRPLRQLVSLMGHAEEGDFLVRAPVHGADEVGQVSKAFNTMLAAITDMRIRELERSTETATATAQERVAAQLEEKNQVIAAKNRELEERLNELTLLMEVTKSLTNTLSLDEQLEILSSMLAKKLGFKEFTLMLLDRPAGLLRVAAAVGFPDEMGIREMTFAVGEGIAGLVAQTGQTVVVPDTSLDGRYLAYKGRFTPRGSLVSVPVLHNGLVMGVVNVFRHQVDGFRHDEVQLVESVAAQAGLAIANAKLFGETVAMSLTDSLTELPNRRALDARLEAEVARADRYGGPFSLVMLDVDNFKSFNERHGRLAGDDVLQGVARALCQTVRKADTVARYGGEEFCVILPRQDAQAAREVCDKLRRAVQTRALGEDLSRPGVEAITVSAGAATYPDDGGSVGDILHAADAAVRFAQRQGSNNAAHAQDLRPARPPSSSPPPVDLAAPDPAEKT